MNLHSERRHYLEKPMPREKKARVVHYELGEKLDRLMNSRKRKTDKMANNAGYRRTSYIETMEYGRVANGQEEKDSMTNLINNGAILQKCYD